MKNYIVTGHCEVVCSMNVKAENEEEAIKKANKDFGGLANYVGLGGRYCLVGVSSNRDERCVLPVSDPVFDDCQEV